MQCHSKLIRSKSLSDDGFQTRGSAAVDTLIERAERADAELYHQFISMAPPMVKKLLGISAARLGGGIVTSVREDVTGFWSNAQGFSFDEPFSAALIDQTIDFLTGGGNLGALIHIAPALLPSDWAEICKRHRIQPSGARYQHICSLEDVCRSVSTDLDVGPMTDVLEWTRFTLRGFDMPDGDLAEMLVPHYSADNVQTYAAWDGDQMVAGASLFFWQDVAVLNSGSTLPSHRNRGAQSALIAARIGASGDAGCRRLVAQTAKPAPGGSNPSTDNMTRSGLRPLYANPCGRGAIPTQPQQVRLDLEGDFGPRWGRRGYARPVMRRDDFMPT
jgi:hypothetical protein